MKEVGKIKDGKVTFLQLTFSASLKTGNITTDCDLDNRVIDTNKKERLEELVNEFVRHIYECAHEESEDKQ